MGEKKYKFLGMILSDGDTFEVQEEEPNTNPHNPSGIGIVVFNHNLYTGWKEIKPTTK